MKGKFRKKMIKGTGSGMEREWWMGREERVKIWRWGWKRKKEREERKKKNMRAKENRKNGRY